MEVGLSGRDLAKWKATPRSRASFAEWRGFPSRRPRFSFPAAAAPPMHRLACSLLLLCLLVLSAPLLAGELWVAVGDKGRRAVSQDGVAWKDLPLTRDADTSLSD